MRCCSLPSSAKNQLATASGPQVVEIRAQIGTVTNNLNSRIANLNQTTQQLNALIQTARDEGVEGFPNATINTVPSAPGSASPSVP